MGTHEWGYVELEISRCQRAIKNRNKIQAIVLPTLHSLSKRCRSTCNCNPWDTCYNTLPKTRTAAALPANQSLLIVPSAKKIACGKNKAGACQPELKDCTICYNTNIACGKNWQEVDLRRYQVGLLLSV